jgi:hypothetical protein
MSKPWGWDTYGKRGKGKSGKSGRMKIYIKENTNEKEKTNAERREGDSWASSL